MKWLDSILISLGYVRSQAAEDLEQTFDLRWEADLRAIRRWQIATGKTLTWPDHADLCVWLLESLDVQEREIGRLRTAFRVNMLKAGASDADINNILEPGPAL